MKKILREKWSRQYDNYWSQEFDIFQKCQNYQQKINKMNIRSIERFFQVRILKRKEQYDDWYTDLKRECNWIFETVTDILAENISGKDQIRRILFINRNIRAEERSGRDLAI